MTFNKIFIFIFILGGFIACSQEVKNDFSSSLVVPKNEVLLIPANGLVYCQNKPFSGISVTFYDNDIKAESIQYANGKKHGFYQKWSQDGTLSFEAPYIHDKQHGTVKTWWKNGQLRSEGQYENGLTHGKQRQWYKSGAKFKERNIVNGQEQGLQKAWRENGRIFGLKRANLCYELQDEAIQYKE